MKKVFTIVDLIAISAIILALVLIVLPIGLELIAGRSSPGQHSDDKIVIDGHNYLKPESDLPLVHSSDCDDPSHQTEGDDARR